MNQVFVCSSPFHLYVSILKTINSKDVTAKTLVIINDHIPDMDKVIPGLIENNFFDYHTSVPFTKISRKKVSKITRALNRNNALVKRVDSESGILKFEEFIREAEINIFNNRGPAYSYFLLKFKNSYIRLLEDGLGNYYSLIGKVKVFKRKYILNTVIGAGHDKQVKEILVQYPEKVIDALKKKAKKLDLKEMQESLSLENKNKILNVFMQGVEMGLSKKKKLLLITQPLEEEHMTEVRKIGIYNQLLERYASTHDVFIKPHPRENTDYAKVLSYSSKIIPKSFPLEMFDLMNEISFDIGLTICSSSLNNLSCIEKKIFLGMEYLKKPVPSNWYEKFEN